MFREDIQIALSTPYTFCHKREIKAAAWASALVRAASLRGGNYMVEGLNLTPVDVFPFVANSVCYFPACVYAYLLKSTQVLIPLICGFASKCFYVHPACVMPVIGAQKC